MKTEVTKEYYSMVDDAVSSLIDLMDDVLSSNTLFYKARQLYPGLVQKHDRRSLSFVMLHDLMHCYKKMGFDFRIASTEGLGLMLLTACQSERIIVKYENVELARGILNDAYTKLIDHISGQLSMIPDDMWFLFEKIFDQKPEIRKRYLMRLYRLCSAIAKADEGNLDKTKSGFLSSLVERSKNAVQDNQAPHENKPLDILIDNREENKKGITQEFIVSSADVVEDLIKFQKELENNQGFRRAADSFIYSNLYREKGVKALIFADLFKCCKQLGVSLAIDRRYGVLLESPKETLPMAMFATPQSIRRDCPPHQVDSMFEAISTSLRKYAQDVFFVIGNALSDNELMASRILKKLNNPVLFKKYCVLLYRVCSVMAKADGTISPVESQYLASLIETSRSQDILIEQYDENKVVDIEPEKPKHSIIIEGKPEVKVHEERTTEQKPTEKAVQELDKLIGLEGVKAEVHTLANYALVRTRRKQAGLKTTPMSLHCVFSGNPGTGKTTVARIMGKLYHELGLLSGTAFVEADRSKLVAEYIGQTAIKTNEVIDSAIGGVLFIDEAYSLANQGKNDFGHEAISTLLKRMEDDRDKLVVILAGYTNEMEEFIASNPGLRSRFSRWIPFEDYSASELYDIFMLQVKNYEYTITDEACTFIKERFEKVVAEKTVDFGNARYVRNFFERTLESQANRVAFLPVFDKHSLSNITLEDVQCL